MRSDSSKAHCFCNSGWGGPSCELMVKTSTDKPINATPILIGFVVVLLAILLILAGCLYVKIKRLNSDDMAYGQMKDDGTAPDLGSLPAGPNKA